MKIITREKPLKRLVDEEKMSTNPYKYNFSGPLTIHVEYKFISTELKRNFKHHISETNMFPLLTFLALVAAISAKDWFVAPGATGSGNNAGDPASFQVALDSSTNGDNILLASGVYNASIERPTRNGYDVRTRNHIRYNYSFPEVNSIEEVYL